MAIYLAVNRKFYKIRHKLKLILSTIRTAVDLTHKIYEDKTNAPKGPSIVVLHGLLGSKKNWDSMCKKISKETKRTVVAADIRNHGESPHNNSHTYIDLASDVSKLIDTLSLKQTAIIGHSMGGKTAMVLALLEVSIYLCLFLARVLPIELRK